MRRLVIANRGEIARRILRAARARGYRVAVISTPADPTALVRREADEVLEVGSFLDGEAIVVAAKAWSADLLRPGYGYLSENTAFAAAFEARILAEDPRTGFLPALGTVRRYREPGREGVRVDSGIGEGSVVTTAFDSLLAKLIEIGGGTSEILRNVVVGEMLKGY